MCPMARTYRKSSRGVPDGYFAWEAAGLRWLAVPGGTGVAEVLGVGEQHLDLPFLDSAAPDPSAAEDFGRGLAVVHGAGATSFGAPPADWSGDGWLGPLSEPLPMRLGGWDRWGEFYAEARIEPLARTGRERGIFDDDDVATLERCAATVASGTYDTGERAARLHGDLWSGNVMWTPDGVVLIDPAAHGGHHEADLAMLALFGCPHLDRVLAAYDEGSPLAEGWQDRVLLHQLHPLLVHAVLFGGSYVRRALSAAERYA